MFYIIEPKDNSVTPLNLKQCQDTDVLRDYVKEGRPYILIQWHRSEKPKARREFFVMVGVGATKNGVGDLKCNSRDLGIGDHTGFFITEDDLQITSVRCSGRWPNAVDSVPCLFKMYDWAICRYYGDGVDGHAVADSRELYSNVLGGITETENALDGKRGCDLFERNRIVDKAVVPIVEKSDGIINCVRDAVGLFSKALNGEVNSFVTPVEIERIECGCKSVEEALNYSIEHKLPMMVTLKTGVRLIMASPDKFEIHPMDRNNPYSAYTEYIVTGTRYTIDDVGKFHHGVTSETILYEQGNVDDICYIDEKSYERIARECGKIEMRREALQKQMDELEAEMDGLNDKYRVSIR